MRCISPRMGIVVVVAAVVVLAIQMSSAAETGSASPPWKAGIATVVITPEQPMWMAGYAARNRPSEGKIHDLNAKALALEDAGGTRMVLVTVDLIGIPREFRDRMVKEVGERYKLAASGLLVNASHTHSGPELRDWRGVADVGSCARANRAEQAICGCVVWEARGPRGPCARCHVPGRVVLYAWPGGRRHESPAADAQRLCDLTERGRPRRS